MLRTSNSGDCPSIALRCNWYNLMDVKENQRMLGSVLISRFESNGTVAPQDNVRGVPRSYYHAIMKRLECG
jgi:hypothetical protein